ncbi:hypothetical protein AKO1_012714 [Acrasis kona]|uniref:Ankyrin repeat protein n=1 Tax=Acrasis kona TaxID=1008807 RepID=A0AAW2YK76_9EUKA
MMTDTLPTDVWSHIISFIEYNGRYLFREKPIPTQYEFIDDDLSEDDYDLSLVINSDHEEEFDYQAREYCKCLINVLLVCKSMSEAMTRAMYILKKNKNNVIYDFIACGCVSLFVAALDSYDSDEINSGIMDEVYQCSHVNLVKFCLNDDRVHPSLHDGAVCACKSGCVQVLDLILSDPRAKNLDYKALLKIACAQCNTEAVKLILRDPRGANVNYSDIFSLQCSRSQNPDNLGIVQMLLQDERVDPSYQNSLCLSNAIYSCNDEIVRMLLMDKRANPSDVVDDYISSCDFGDVGIVRMLLIDGRLNPSVENSRALTIATQHKYDELAMLLLQDERMDTSKVHYKENNEECTCVCCRGLVYVM